MAEKKETQKTDGGREKSSERRPDRVSKGSQQQEEIPQVTQNEKEREAQDKG